MSSRLPTGDRLYRVCMAIAYDPALLTIIVVMTICKLINWRAFSGAWIVLLLIVWCGAWIILVARYFDELSRHVDT